jgi:SNF family Na+-dependent transporter
MKDNKRESWASRLGVIFAISGAAVGLGNLIRFPSLIAKSGSGGSFMIPYFVALLILGVPILWVEWTLGRMGGKYGQGTLPMIFNIVWKKTFAKYLGVFGLAAPLFIASYYTWVTSWGLAYSFFSLVDKFHEKDKTAFLQNFTSVNGGYFNYSMLFYIITLLLLYFILSKGIQQGIEKYLKILMPLLFIFGIFMTAKVLLLGKDIVQGLSYIWEPNFKELTNWSLWIMAAGQIFFTLSIGQEVSVYASYLKEDDDIALGPLTTASLNEFVEVIIGSTITIIPIFFYIGYLSSSDTEGYNLASTAMPLVIEKMLFGNIFGCAWFFLIFLAGFTTIIASCQIFISFLVDNFNIKTSIAAFFVLLTIFLISLPPILWYHKGVFDDVDFWMGSLFLVFSSFMEVFIFGWIIGINNGFEELKKGAKICVPSFFKYIIKYISPFLLIFILFAWLLTDGLQFIMNANKYIWIERGIMIFVVIVILLLIKFAAKNNIKNISI